jgi:hypothetical protein
MHQISMPKGLFVMLPSLPYLTLPYQAITMLLAWPQTKVSNRQAIDRLDDMRPPATRRNLNGSMYNKRYWYYRQVHDFIGVVWVGGLDLNQRPSGYEKWLMLSDINKLTNSQ